MLLLTSFLNSFLRHATNRRKQRAFLTFLSASLVAFMIVGLLAESSTRWRVWLAGAGLLLHSLAAPSAVDTVSPTPLVLHVGGLVLDSNESNSATYAASNGSPRAHTISLHESHTKLHKSLPSSLLEFEKLREEIFARSSGVGCSAWQQLDQSGWRVCTAGKFNPSAAGVTYASCLRLVVGDNTAHLAALARSVPCAGSGSHLIVLGFYCSGLPALYQSSIANSQNGTEKTRRQLSDVLVRANTRDSPIELMLIECPAESLRMLECTSLDNQMLLGTVHQMVLRSPESSQQHPLRYISLMSGLHANGLRQWHNAVVNCSDSLTDPVGGRCWEQSLLSVRYVLDQPRVVVSTGYEAASRLENLNLTAHLANYDHDNLLSLYRASIRQVHVVCPAPLRIGVKATATSWDVCMAEKFQPGDERMRCIALAFPSKYALRNESEVVYSELAVKHRCWVHVFQGAGNKNDHRAVGNRATVWRHRLLLGVNSSITSDGIKIRPLCQAVQDLGYSADRLIDIAQFSSDSPNPSWVPAIIAAAATEDGCLAQFKQLILDLPIVPLGEEVTSNPSYLHNLKTHLILWQALMRLGFRVWRVDSTPSSKSNETRSDASFNPSRDVIRHHLINGRHASALMRETLV